MSTLETLPHELLDRIVARLLIVGPDSTSNHDILTFARCSPNFAKRSQAAIYRSVRLSAENSEAFLKSPATIRKEFPIKELEMDFEGKQDLAKAGTVTKVLAATKGKLEDFGLRGRDLEFDFKPFMRLAALTNLTLVNSIVQFSGKADIKFHLKKLSIGSCCVPSPLLTAIAKSSKSTLQHLALDLLPPLDEEDEDEDDEDESSPAPLRYAIALPLLAPVFPNLTSLDLRGIYPGEPALIFPFCTKLKKVILSNPENPDEDEFDLEHFKTIFGSLPSESLVELEIDFCVANTAIEGDIKDEMRVERAFRGFLGIPQLKNLRRLAMLNVQDDVAQDLYAMVRKFKEDGMEVRMTSDY